MYFKDFLLGNKGQIEKYNAIKLYKEEEEEASPKCDNSVLIISSRSELHNTNYLSLKRVSVFSVSFFSLLLAEHYIHETCKKDFCCQFCTTISPYKAETFTMFPFLFYKLSIKQARIRAIIPPRLSLPLFDLGLQSQESFFALYCNHSSFVVFAGSPYVMLRPFVATSSAKGVMFSVVFVCVDMCRLTPLRVH